MDPLDKVSLAAARTDSMAAASVAISGVIALCNELALTGALDEQQLNRIRAFMLLAIEQSPATSALRLHMHGLIGEHFSELRNRMS